MYKELVTYLCIHCVLSGVLLQLMLQLPSCLESIYWPSMSILNLTVTQIHQCSGSTVSPHMIN